MPSHWSSPALHIVTGSSPTGTQWLHAVGCAHAARYVDPASDEVTLACGGDGCTSEGEFWESVNAACLERLPVVFLVEDNGYAISVPVECQTAGGNIAALLSGFPGLARFEVDGTDFPRVLQGALRRPPPTAAPAMARPLSAPPSPAPTPTPSRTTSGSIKPNPNAPRKKPAIPSSSSPQWLVAEGILERHALQRIDHEVDSEIQEVTDRVLHAPPPAKGSAFDHLYSDRIDPTSSQFHVDPQFTGDPRTMVDEINLTLHEEMRRDSRIVVFGEDVADCSRAANLNEVKGKGGVFKATNGLQREFGYERCFNSPIAEAAIIGRSIGMAERGLKPVPEIQFFDYIWPAMMQIRDELVTIRWRSNNGFSAPMVIRVAIGGYLNGGAIYHSQCGEVVFTHLPGLRVVMPSNALDACGLLRTALRSDDPVLFLEHKKLYREPYNRSPHPGPDFTIPFGKANVVRAGNNLTIITYGALVQKSLQAALQVEQRNPGKTIEIIDLRSLAPYDWEAIRASVEKTSRVIVAYEDTMSFGYGAELAARIAGDLFEHLDAPVKRVAALDTWVAYNPQLEAEILPQVEDLAREAEALLNW